MPDYQWIVQPRNGAPVGELALTNRRIALPLNRPPEASAELRVTDNTPSARLLSSGTSELVIYRDGVPLESVFQLNNVSITGDTETQRYELAWLGALSYLQHGLVLTGETQASVAQSRLVWDLINTFQGRTGASVYGITDGGAPASDPTKSVTYEEDTDLLDAIIALSERNDGFDFAIDAARRFRCYYPQRGEDKTDTIVLEYGVNVTSFQVDFDTSPGEIVTDTRVYGGPDTTVVTSTDAAAQALFGRREASIQYSDVISEVSALQQQADSIVASRARPQSIPQVTLRRDHPSIPWGSYDLGDTVTVRIKAGALLELDAPFRIAQIMIDLDDNNNETISLDLNDA